MKTFRLFSLGLALAIGVEGCCTSLRLPRDQTNFAGLAELATNSAARGVGLAGSTAPLRLFLIHGMGSHDQDWGTNYLDPIRARLGPGWVLDLTGDHPVQWSVPTNKFVGSVRVYRVRKDQDIRIIVYQLTWSPLTQPFKNQRFQSDTNLWRPLVNQAVREVIDENLSDVVLYLGGFDANALNKTVQAALTNFYSGTWDPAPGTRAVIAESPVAVITESLGSVMFVDALDALDGSATNSSDLRPVARRPRDERLSTFMKNTQIVFFMANQLNLLEMPAPAASGQVPPDGAAEATPGSAKRGRRLLRELLRLKYNAVNPQRRRASLGEQASVEPPPAGAKPLFIIAFNDPYDVLSFRVNQSDLGEYSPWAVIDNFAPRNACDWFGLYESIATAHTGYKDNSHVTAVVVDGYHKGRSPTPTP